MPKLEGKQDKFCEEYLIDLNATQAAIRAGYSEKTARQIGSQNLSKLDIQQAIAELKAVRSKRTKVTADEVVNTLADIMRGNICDTDGDGNSKGVKTYDIRGAADSLGKHLGINEKDNLQKAGEPEWIIDYSKLSASTMAEIKSAKIKNPRYGEVSAG